MLGRGGGIIGGGQRGGRGGGEEGGGGGGGRGGGVRAVSSGFEKVGHPPKCLCFTRESGGDPLSLKRSKPLERGGGFRPEFLVPIPNLR